jgi:hypothetical protein
MTHFAKRKILIFGSFLCFIFSPVQAQDSTYYKMSPSGASVAEGRLIRVVMPEDYMQEKKTVKEGKWVGIGLSFHSNIFANMSDIKRLRTGDYIGVAGGIGGSRHGLWYNARLDLGWQVHYAFTPRSDFGFRAYGMVALDKIAFNGIMLHPSFRFGGVYLDLVVGIPIGYPIDMPRTYAEGNLRLLFPNDSKTETDRWYVGFKTIYTQGTNFDNSRTNTAMSQFHFTTGLML